MYEFLF